MDTNKNVIKGILTILTTLFIFALWILPAYMMMHGHSGKWAVLYMPIFVITVIWVFLMSLEYFNLKDKL